MCGIAGISGQADPALLATMIDRITHRGPDGRGEFQAPLTRHTSGSETGPPAHVALGHTRLSVIDLSDNSAQPFTSNFKSAVIVYNGEIYNFKEKRAELEKKGFLFRSKGDAEVLLNLYLAYGVDCLQHLDGMFAFAIWDSDKQQLFLARDPFGIKPLYYTQTETAFLFASEMKSLLACPDIDLTLNLDAIYRTVQYLFSPGPDTIIKAVHKLEPGHYLIVDGDTIVEHELYWRWDKYNPHLRDENTARQMVKQTLRTSVRSQLVADVPVGTFLSGGLDSSLVTALAKEAGANDLRSFTIRQTRSDAFKDGFVADLPFAIQVASRLSLDLQLVDNDTTLSGELRDLVYQLDEPQADVAALYVSQICQEARAQGITVLLSGLGGDDFFGGYRRHLAIKFERYWSGIPKGWRKHLTQLGKRLPGRMPIFRRLASILNNVDLDGDERLLSYFHKLPKRDVLAIFSADSRVRLSENPNESILQVLSALGDIEPLEKMLHLERRYFLGDHCLAYTDRMSMKHGVEVRVPFVTTQLAELVMSLPAEFKQKGRQGKWLLKTMAERFLDRRVIYRSKTGFDGPLREWLQTDLAPLVEDCLSPNSIEKRGIFDAQVVHQLVQDNRDGRVDYAYPIYAILCIELWCRIHLDKPGEVLAPNL